MTASKWLMHMFQLFLYFLMILGPYTGSCQAQEELREMDFSYGRKILLGSESPLYQFKLDAHIYRHITDERLIDLRIFNHQKELVPLRIRSAANPLTKRSTSRKVPIFPFYDESDNPSGRVTLNLKKDTNETIIDFSTDNSRDYPSGILGFLMDLGQEKPSPRKLVVDLKHGRAEHRLAVEVSFSRDLSHWRSLVSSAALVKMTFKGQSLQRNQIDLPAFSGRYLRLSFRKPFQGELSASVAAVYASLSQNANRHATAVKGKRTSTQPLVFTYDTQGFFPTDRIQLGLSKANRLIKARLSSRADSELPWRELKTGIFFRLNIDNVDLQNSPITLPVTQNRFYRLEILSGTLPKNGSAPELQLMWYPHECAFVASGEPPFMLVYGNADLVYEPQVVDELLEAIGQKNQKNYLGYSRLDPPQVLGGEERLKVSRYFKIRWLRWVLWTVLGISIAGLTFMAYRLYRQMKG
jgi:hypothetical protein